MTKEMSDKGLLQQESCSLHHYLSDSIVPSFIQTREEEEEEFDQSEGDKNNSGDDDYQEKAEPKKSKKQSKVKKVAKNPGDGSGVSNKIEVRRD